MTTPGSGGGDTGDDRWPPESAREPVPESAPRSAPPDGEQATTALPRRTGSYPYPYPDPAPSPYSEPGSDDPTGAHPEHAPGPPAGWAPPGWSPPGGVSPGSVLPGSVPPGSVPPTAGPPPTNWAPPVPGPPSYYSPPSSPPPGSPPYAAPSGPGWVAPPHQAPIERHDPTAPRYQSPPRGSHLPPYDEPFAPTPEPPPGPPPDGDAATAPRRTGPKKLTVTRVAAFRSRELTTRGVEIFRRAAAADGADRSGLTALTYATMANYAVDAALAIALANTLFFAAATAESTGKVLLYLVITIAPFAVIAPFIGPAIDRLQRGRRIALATAFFTRTVLALVMAFNFDSWVLYPAALGMLVMSKSFSVLKAALTPRVLPPDITLVKTNSRLTVFGLIAGGVSGAVAGLLAWLSGTTGPLILTALCAIAGGVLCLRIPGWVESTEGEVPVETIGRRDRAKRRFTLPVVTTLWANGSIRVETGFLALFIAFVIKSEFTEASGFTQLLLLGLVGAAAGIGGFIGNGLGARLPLTAPETTAIVGLGATLVSTVIAILAPGLVTAAIVGLVGSTASSLAKVCLDSVIQHELPEASRASAFGRSETVLQLSWVFGGVVGLLIGGVWSFGHDKVYGIGFSVVSVLLAVGLVQSLLVRRGGSLFPWLDYSKLTSRFRRGSSGTATSVIGGHGAAPPAPSPGAGFVEPTYPSPPGPATTQWTPPVGPPGTGPQPGASSAAPPPARRAVRDAHKPAKNRKKA